MTVWDVLFVAYATIVVFFMLVALVMLVPGIKSGDPESVVFGAGTLMLALVWPVGVVVLVIIWSVNSAQERKEVRTHADQ